MTDTEWIHENMSREDAAGLLVRDVMVRRPKTLPADASVADLREQFANPRVRTALLADGERFAGAIAPSELPDDAPATERARTYARIDVPTLPPDATMADALALMDDRGDHRLVVVDGAGSTLVGLLCMDRSGTSFCTFSPPQAP
jgi:CBS-domain-containing membrane protein